MEVSYNLFEQHPIPKMFKERDSSNTKIYQLWIPQNGKINPKNNTKFNSPNIRTSCEIKIEKNFYFYKFTFIFRQNLIKLFSSFSWKWKSITKWFFSLNETWRGNARLIYNFIFLFFGFFSWLHKWTLKLF